MNWKTFAYFIFLVCFPYSIFGQSDSLYVEGGESIQKVDLMAHSPKKAALYSLFPGGGQIYNKKYWKIPIIYAGLGVSAYFMVWNHNEFKSYKEEAINRYNYGITENYPELSDEQVLEAKEYYENNRNISFLVLLLVYFLNIVDATVDAHFFEYDVSPDVSFRAEPYIRPSEFHTTTPINAGITLSLKL